MYVSARRIHRAGFERWSSCIAPLPSRKRVKNEGSRMVSIYRLLLRLVIGVSGFRGPVLPSLLLLLLLLLLLSSSCCVEYVAELSVSLSPHLYGYQVWYAWFTGFQ
ncbi:unnamed protein product [Periconia digitata]|uniref:Uncharacterized protein n=1 Tax=Periconia digitata TaxID=1303443 RepID=A0A9W4XJM0_9PLEO|nr:unnamed protein product [Periconia digitata]